MKNSLRALFVAVLTMVWGSVFAQEVSSVKWEASSGEALTTIYVGNDVKLTWEEGGGDFSPKYSGESVYFYNGNRLIVAGTSTDVKITKVVVSFSGEKYSLVTCNSSGKNENTVGITNSSADMTSTWEGEQNSIIFRASKQTGVRYITSIEVFYTGGAPVIVKEPKLNISSTTIGSTYDMDEAPVFVVYYDNAEGTAAAENAKLTVYVDGIANKEEDCGTLAVGATGLWKNMKFDLTNLTAGEHQVYVSLTADGAEEAKTEVQTVTFTKAAPEATFELFVTDELTVEYGAESYSLVATVKNTSEIDAENVEVMLQQNIQNVVDPQTVSIAAGASQKVAFTVPGPFTSGEAKLWVVVKAYDKTMVQQQVVVTFEEEPIIPVIDLAITAVQGSLDLTLENNYLTVFVDNKGNVDIADAAVTIKAGESVLGTAKVSAKADNSGFCSVAINTENLTAGELEITATVEVEGDANVEDNTFTKTVTVEGAPQPEPTFSVSAENVSVPYGDESYDVVAVVSNTSEVNAENVEVKLLKGIEVVDTKTIETLAAGATTNVTFTIGGGPFAPGSANYYVVVGNSAQDEVTITFEEEPIIPVIDLAITAVQGSLNLTLENNYLTVFVDNKGTVDIADAPVTIKAGESVLGIAKVSVKADNSGFCSVEINTENLTAGELEITATVELEGDANVEDNTLTKTVTVEGAPQPEPTFSVSAADVEVEYGATSFDIVAVVSNTSEVNAENVEVKLMQGTVVVGTKTIESLAAGVTTNVTFTVSDILEAGKTASYYVQVANQVQDDVTVSFLEEPVVDVSDLAITTVQGCIYLDLETNYVTVFVENKGDVDIVDAIVTLTAGDKVIGTGLVSARAGEERNTGFCSIEVDTEGLVSGDLEVTATVTVEGEAAETLNDNTMTVPINVYESTGIESLTPALSECEGAVYNLQGVKVKTLQKGNIYIVNGRKMLVK